jgi:hypothetical protein
MHEEWNLDGVLDEIPEHAKGAANASLLVLKSSCVDAIDVGHQDTCRVIFNTRHERLKPAILHLNVWVEDCEGRRACLLRSSQTSLHETRSLRKTGEACLGEQLDVVLEGLMEVLLGAAVINKDDLVKQLGRGAIEDTVDGPEQGGQRLVVEDHHDRRWRQRGKVVYDVLAQLEAVVRGIAVKRKTVAELEKESMATELLVHVDVLWGLRLHLCPLVVFLLRDRMKTWPHRKKI